EAHVFPIVKLVHFQFSSMSCDDAGPGLDGKSIERRLSDVESARLSQPGSRLFGQQSFDAARDRPPGNPIERLSRRDPTCGRQELIGKRPRDVGPRTDPPFEVSLGAQLLESVQDRDSRDLELCREPPCRGQALTRAESALDDGFAISLIEL